MTLTQIIQANAEYMANVSIHVVSNRGTVEISDDSGFQDPIFLQGDDGSAFISEAEALWNESGDVVITDCWAHVAKPYVDCLWN